MNDEQLMLISEEDKFITNYKAMYQAMTAKTDCKSKIFPSDVIITKEDICDLNNMIVEKFQSHYEDAGFTINVTVNFEGRKSIEFSTWREFEEYKFGENACIDSITIKWEYNAKLPQYKIPQRHTLFVRMTDGLKFAEMLNLVLSGNLENIQELDSEISPVIARVDFISSILGDELLAIVEQWNNGLSKPEEERNPFIKFLSKHRRKLAYLLSYISLFFISICGATTILTYMEKRLQVEKIANFTMEQFSKLVYIALFVIIVCVVLYRVSEFLSNVCFKMLEHSEMQHIFNISKGDRKRQKQLGKYYKKNMLQLTLSTIGSILLDVICAIISIFIEKML